MTRLCFVRTEPREVLNPECPNAASHTPQPVDYAGFFEWARDMAKTHVQRRCPPCQLYALWVERVLCSDCGRRYAPIGDGTPRSHRATTGYGRCPGAHEAPAVRVGTGGGES